MPRGKVVSASCAARGLNNCPNAYECYCGWTCSAPRRLADKMIIIHHKKTHNTVMTKEMLIDANPKGSLDHLRDKKVFDHHGGGITKAKLKAVTQVAMSRGLACSIDL